MARGNSYFAVVAKERARAEREAQKAQERREREATKAAERWQREAARQAEKDTRQRYLQERTDQAAERTKDLTDRIEALRNMLAHTLGIDDLIEFDDLRIHDPYPPFRAPAEPAPQPRPREDTCRGKVPVPGALERLLPWVKTRYQDALDQATADYARAVQCYDMQEQQRQAKIAATLEAARQDYEKAKEAFLLKVQQRNQEIDAFEAAYHSGDRDAILTYNTMVLERSEYPDGCPQQFRMAYVPESKELVIEYELPAPAIIPTIADVRYVKAKDTYEEKPRKPAEIKELYQDMVAAVALRTLHEVFEADQGNHLAVVVFNGFVQTVDRATGKDIQPDLISVSATKEHFLEINLSRVEKRTCLRNLGAQVSPQPTELVAVKPIVDFDMVDKRFVEQSNILPDLESRPNLMDLNPTEFEHLVSNLFQKMGLETKLTRSSRDGGVDAVAFDIRPVLGGKVVIQAKRYKNPVGVSAVRDLYGTMNHEGANKGILVTTSSYGPDAFEFVKDKPVELIDGGGLLYLLEQVGVKARIIMPVEG